MARENLLLIKGSLMAFRLEGANHIASRGASSHAVHGAAVCSPRRNPHQAPLQFDPHEVGVLSPFCLKWP